MEKIITIRTKQFKCHDDGRCYVWKDNSACGKLKNPYWHELKSKNIDGYCAYHSHSSGIFKVHRILATAFLDLDFDDVKKIVDHIDGNRSNNIISNLRLVSHTENCMNIKKKEIKGMMQRENGTWRAYINNHKDRYSKTFKTKEEAIQWRLEKEKEFGYLHTIN